LPMTEVTPRRRIFGRPDAQCDNKGRGQCA
jgi:hypothetical protein